MSRTMAKRTPLVAPVRQDRSARTQRKLIAAAQALLSSRAPHTITTQDVATKAGLSVGIVYRRFADKEALFETAFAHHFAERTRARDVLLAELSTTNASLPQTVRAIVENLTTEDRRHRVFLQSYLTFVATAQPPARKRLERRNAAAFEAIVASLDAAASKHAAARASSRARFAVTIVAHTLRGLVVLEQHSSPTGVALTDRELIENLTLATVAYLNA